MRLTTTITMTTLAENAMTPFHSSDIPGNRLRKILYAILLTLFIILPATALAGDRLYFVSLVENNQSSGAPQVLLEWGALEGSIPAEINTFMLYRKVDGGAHELLMEIPHSLSAPETIRALILNDGDADRLDGLLTVLNDISASLTPDAGPIILADNFHTFLYDLLNPTSVISNPLQRLLLTRLHPGIARAMGLAHVDASVEAGKTYSYMLTGVTSSGESLPIGQSPEIDPLVPTVLPAPTGLRQVEIAGCSDIRKNLDDLRIHLSWDIPAGPNEIGLNILTYGYDLFWSADNLGPLELNQGIPAALHRVNPKPIVISGPPASEGPDSYLARDSADNHLSAPPWQRPQKFYYYLAARDLAGHYSATSAALEATVVDRQPPAAPWRVHTEEFSQIVGGIATPRLSLDWDQINPVNYIRYFETDRAICSSEDNQVCTAPAAEDCSDIAKLHCVDLDVVNYRIFRFASQKDASNWGIDTDGDLWPDNLEVEHETDPCDAADMPNGQLPPELFQDEAGNPFISQDNPAYQRALSPKHIQMHFVDTTLTTDAYNAVFYYRILAEDGYGNRSPLSPPIRGLLVDRSQPTVSADLQSLNCDTFSATHAPTSDLRLDTDLLTLIDQTGKAHGYQLTKYCDDYTGTTGDPLLFTTTVMARGTLTDNIAHITAETIAPYDCENTGCAGAIGYIVTFFDDIGQPLTSSGYFSMIDLCSAYSGAITLDANCFWVAANSPGQVVSAPLKACVDLSAGQLARVYHEIGGEMSPAATITYSPDAENNGKSCLEMADLAGLVPADLCMGMRVFSENHVGSPMNYLNCLEMLSGAGSPPPPPLIEGVYSKETAEGEAYFEARWSAPQEGQAAFVLAMKSAAGNSRYQTLWPDSQDDSGQFSHNLSLDPSTDLNQEWCVRLRTISTTMQRSDWSQETCATWKSTEPENLDWPRMYEPSAFGSLQAFFINEGAYGGRPALRLSGDLAALIGAAGELDAVPSCDGSAICVESIGDLVSFTNQNLCSFVTATVSANNFIVYRQEQGKDFVQNSPLVGSLSYGTWINTKTDETFYSLIDPLFTLRNLTDSSIGGVDPENGALDPTEFSGARFFFLDRYPHVAGATVRYKMVFIDPMTHEPKNVSTSNWLTLP